MIEPGIFFRNENTCTKQRRVGLESRKDQLLEYKPFFYTEIKSKPVLLGTILALAYLLPTTIFPLWMGEAVQQGMVYGSRIFVPLILIYLFVKGIRRFSSTRDYFYCYDFAKHILCRIFYHNPFMKWIGWVLLFSIVGPVIMSRNAVIIRDSAWKTVRLAVVIIGIGSFFWYVLRLPNFGRGVFTGITVHSMLLGPMAGMAALICIHKAVETRSLKFVALSLLIIVPCMLSGSRSAVLSLLVGVLVLVWLACIHSGMRRNAPIIIGSIFVAALGFAFIEGVKSTDRTYALTHALEEKGLNNSRELLWEARMSEFQESPAFGIGIGMGKGDESAGVVFDSSGSINIEPGSSLPCFAFHDRNYGNAWFCPCPLWIGPHPAGA